jgi:hypothetical protein
MSRHTRQAQPWLSDRAYNFLKFLAQILLPALGTLYFALAQIWGLPAADEVVGSIVAVDTFLGVLLGISSAQYSASDSRYDGVMEVHPADPNGRVNAQLELHKGPEVIVDKSEVVFKVRHVEEVEATTPGDLPHVPPTTP